jgi:glycosyltransferase involved in cell wall biosynthesis
MPQPRNRTKLRLAILLGQPVQYFAPLFRELARRDEIELTVIYCSPGGATPYFDPEFGLTVSWDTPVLDGYRYKFIRSLWPNRTQGMLAYVAPGILAQVRKERFDVLLAFGWSNLTCWLAFAKAFLGEVPWMLYGDTNVLYETEKYGVKRWLRNWLLGSLFRRTSAFLVSTSMNREFYELHGVDRTRCFRAPLVVDPDVFGGTPKNAAIHRDQVRKQHGIPLDAVLLLFVGKLVPRKRPHDVLSVLEVLQDECPKLAVAFVGDGPLRCSLESYIVERRIMNAVLVGFKNQSELPAMYAMSDIFVLPSSKEPLGVVTLEAMACGLPVVVTDRTGLWGPEDAVRNGENGFVYPSGNVAELAAAVRRLVLDRTLRERMGSKSREIVKDFSVERCANGILRATEFTHRNCALRSHRPNPLRVGV